MKPFPCTRCGECCRSNVQKILDLQKDEKVMSIPKVNAILSTFPYKMIDGHCEKLNPDNTCSVYSTRPAICNIEEASKVLITALSREERYKLAASECNTMIKASTVIPGKEKFKFFVKL